MSNQIQANTLSPNQLKRIEATLKRIRGGLSRASADPFDEPAHTFQPEAFRNEHT